MVELRDSILIAVKPERVWEWLRELPRHYVEWHPDHVACHYERGGDMRVGSVLVFEEYLHGRLHRMRLRAIEVTPGRSLRYRGRGFEGSFLTVPEDGGTRFTATLALGTRVPVVEGIVDAVLRLVMRRRLAAFRDHMREEGEHLKRMLEEDDAGPGKPRRTEGPRSVT